jgi:predicted protein tyrosine phosphatase
MNRAITFCGRTEAEAILRRQPFPSVVSISDPNTPKPLVDGERATLRLRFWDVDERIPGYSLYGYPGPTPQAVEKLVSFLSAAELPLLIHCEAGISRSAAATMIGYYLIHGDERAAARDMADSRDGPMRAHVSPNVLMLRHADVLLGTNLSAYA